MAEEISAGIEPERPKGHIRGIWAITIIVVIAILAGGGVWYWYYKTTVQDQTTTNTTKISPSSSPSASGSASASPASDETAGWKTYSNTGKSFSFKHPVEWVESGPNSASDTTIVYVYSDEKIGGGTEPIQYYIFAKQSNSKPNVTYTKDTVGSYTAYITDQEPSQSGCLAYYLTSNETKYIALTLCPYDKVQPFEKQSQYVATFKQILSTFKFL